MQGLVEKSDIVNSGDDFIFHVMQLVETSQPINETMFGL